MAAIGVAAPRFAADLPQPGLEVPSLLRPGIG